MFPSLRIMQRERMPLGYKNVLCVIGLILSSLLSAKSFSDTGSIRLQLFDSVTQRPVKEAEITLVSRSGDRQTLTLNTKGIAQLELIDTGLYAIEVKQDAYQPVRLPSVRIRAQKTTPIILQLTSIKGVMEEITVIGSAINGGILQSSGSSGMDREALRSAAGSGSDVLRALDGLPGLFSDGEYSSYSVRGNGPRDNLITVDGIPFENVVHFSDSYGSQEEVEGGGRYSVFAPNVVSNATFQPGGWSSEYGGRAGSLLELEVAEGNPETPSYTARLDVAGLEVGYDGPTSIPGDTSLLLSARQLNFGKLFEMIGLDDIGTPKLTDVIVKTHSQLGQDDKLNFLVIYAPEEYHRDIENVLASDAEEPGNYEGVELVDTKSDNMLVSSTWSHLAGNNAELKGQLYYRLFSQEATTGEAYPDRVPQGTPSNEIPKRENILTSLREEKEIGLRLDYATDNSLGRLSTGARLTETDLEFGLSLDDNWIRYVYEQSDYRPNKEQKYIELTPVAVNSTYNDKVAQYALYADQELSLSSFDFRIGLRFERDSFSKQSLLSPRFASTWYATKKLRVTGTGGRYHQSPRYNDRALDASNSQLENEVIDQVSLGLKYQVNTSVDVFFEPYYQDLSNLIVKQDGVNQTLRNTGEGRSHGVDIAISRSFDHGWSANLTYSYNDAQIKDSPIQNLYDADFSRPHAVSVGGVWEINTHWKLSGRWKWASGKPTGTYVIHANVLDDLNSLRYSKEILLKNVDRFGAYSSLNFRLDYQRAFGRINLIAFLDVINTLGSDNPGNSIFNDRTGKDVAEDGQAVPLVGLRLEW